MDIMRALWAHFLVQSRIMIHVAKGLGRQIHKQLERSLIPTIVACFEITFCLGVMLQSINLVLYKYFQFVAPCNWGQEFEFKVYINTVVAFRTVLRWEIRIFVLILFDRKFTFRVHLFKHYRTRKYCSAEMFVDFHHLVLFSCPVKNNIKKMY